MTYWSAYNLQIGATEESLSIKTIFRLIQRLIRQQIVPIED